MNAAAPPFTITKGALRTGWFLSGLVGLFLMFDGAARIAGIPPYVEGTIRFGYALSLAQPIGLVLAVSTVAMLIPRTAVLGCILVTGYLGGAVATHVRVQDPSFLFPVAVGVLAWLGLYLREPRLRALVPLRKQPSTDA